MSKNKKPPLIANPAAFCSLFGQFGWRDLYEHGPEIMEAILGEAGE